MDNIYKNEKSLNKVRGNIGEAEAINFLEKQGYRVVDTNYRCPIGEIDIIAQDDADRIIFVEVKARSTAKHGYPREAITRDKQLKIRRTAEFYLKIKRLTSSRVQFDVIEVLAGKITYIKNAF